MDESRQATRRITALPAALGAPDGAAGEDAPVEAVRAIAALLGRATLATNSQTHSGREVAATKQAPGEGEALSDEPLSDAAPLRGDREVLITGAIGTLSDAADAALRDARKRQRRAQRQVATVLEQLSTATPDALSG